MLVVVLVHGGGNSICVMQLPHELGLLAAVSCHNGSQHHEARAARVAVESSQLDEDTGSTIAHLSALLANASLVLALAKGLVEVLGYDRPLPLAMKLHKPTYNKY